MAHPPYIMKFPGARGSTYEIQRISISSGRRPTYYRHAVLYSEATAAQMFDLLTEAAKADSKK